MSGNVPIPADPTAVPTKSVVWKEGQNHTARLIEPEWHGTSKTYRFDRDNNHTVEMDESDVAILMNGDDKSEFRVKRS